MYSTCTVMQLGISTSRFYFCEPENRSKPVKTVSYALMSAFLLSIIHRIKTSIFSTDLQASEPLVVVEHFHLVRRQCTKNLEKDASPLSTRHI